MSVIKIETVDVNMAVIGPRVQKFENSVEKEIQRRILAGNRTNFAAVSLFRC